jgi:hypothetical protein
MRRHHAAENETFVGARAFVLTARFTRVNDSVTSKPNRDRKGAVLCILHNAPGSDYSPNGFSLGRQVPSAVP